MGDEFLIGDWVRDKELGSGSFGVVRLWRNIKTEEKLAIKMCKWAESVQLTAKHKDRWSKEVEMMNVIKHDNIVRTKEIPKDLLSGLTPANISRLPILCMEFCGNGDLRSILNQPVHSNGLPERQVRCILKDMKSAINYLHSLKITHRDLKPENIVLQLEGGDQVDLMNSRVTYKLIDLGYAKEIDSDSVCASFVGTLQYLAPELLYSKTYSNTVDYWSFGLVSHEIITGIRPFLPNLAPVQWMQYVKRKNSDHICVFENLKGEVEYSTSLFGENYISKCLQHLMEKWLKISLDWDPKKRGYNFEEKSVKFTLPEEEEQKLTTESSKESSLIIFSLLDSILSKKILTLFSVATYEHLSYEIGDSTLFTTVQGWIERDTKVHISKQLFITSTHKSVNLHDLASKYWDESLLVMLYFYQTDTLINENVIPKTPPKLQYCLENPNLKFSFSHLSAIFANSLYLIRTEKMLYETLIKAYSFRIEHLKIGVNNLWKRHNESDKLINRLIDKSNLLSSILDINYTFIEENINEPSYDELKLILDKCKELQVKVVKLKDAWTQLSTRLQSAERRCNEINGKELDCYINVNSFGELEKIAQTLFSRVRQIPREERSHPKPCIDAVKIVYKCLKLRDVLLRNVQTQKVVQKILDIFIETEKMSGLILSAGQNAEELSTSLTNIILEKEKISLKILKKSFSTNALPRTVNEIENNEPKSMVVFKIGEAVRSPVPQSYVKPKEKLDLESLVKDNLSLRVATQNIFDKYYEKHQSIKNDLLDFTSMQDM